MIKLLREESLLKSEEKEEGTNKEGERKGGRGRGGNRKQGTRGWGRSQGRGEEGQS